MKGPVLLLALLLPAGCVAAQGGAPAPAPAPGPTVVILVRHAEKASETADDPPLSERGLARAVALSEALRDAGLTGLIVSERLRTHQTAAPAAAGRRLAVDTVPIRGGVRAHVKAVAARIRGPHAGGTVLVVGHSNTIPAIITALGAGPLPDICDAAYADLHVMILGGDERPRLLRTTFGAPDPPGAGECPGMQAR